MFFFWMNCPFKCQNWGFNSNFWKLWLVNNEKLHDSQWKHGIQWSDTFVRFLWEYGDVGSYSPSLFLIKACLWGPLSRQKDNHLPGELTSLCFCLGLNRTATSIVVWSTFTKTIHGSKSGLWHIINFVYEKTSTSCELAACVKTDKLAFTCNNEDHEGEFPD